MSGLTVGLSGIYNYNSNTPFGGFTVESSPGVTSSVKSNGFSINHGFETELFDPLTLRTDIMGSVTLPGTRYNASTNSIGLNGPIQARLCKQNGTKLHAPSPCMDPLSPRRAAQLDLHEIDITATI